jgi:hypothetical protein
MREAEQEVGYLLEVGCFPQFRRRSLGPSAGFSITSKSLITILALKKPANALDSQAAAPLEPRTPSKRDGARAEQQHR